MVAEATEWISEEVAVSPSLLPLQRSCPKWQKGVAVGPVVGGRKGEIPSTTVSLTSITSLEINLSFLTQPLKISCGICSAGSLLLEYMSLRTSYWVLETTYRGMVHSGLWDICLESKCNLYQFNLLALHIHVTRAFLLMGLFCGFMGLLFSCISFERNKLYDVSVIKVAAIFSFSAGFLVLVAMSLFTAILRKSPGYAQNLVIFGSSFSLGWASILMYIITGILLLLTEKTIISLA
ncbi:protein NKG7-like [Pseudonaja textilis]|uniref:protein NKG7-like n=1 Tax=Pseudonaja textilis TaxID=8673 RepID=UPI000EA8677B|nr:protein NKG7-like [Pseudonaja textilis]